MGQLIKFPKKSAKPGRIVQRRAIVGGKKKKSIAAGSPGGTLLFFTGIRYQRCDKVLPSN